MSNIPSEAQSSGSSAAAVPPAFEQILSLGRELESAVSPTMALAFRDNPINRAVIQANRSRRLAVNAYGMEASLAATRRFSFRRVVREDTSSAARDLENGVVGGLIALDPGGYPAALPSVTAQLRCLWGQGFRVMHRWGQLYRELDACHPRDPHCYLSMLAVHPARQRRGVGRRLLDTWLVDVDARSMPSYLETDRNELVAFYQSAGFEVERELEAFGASIWCMSRLARV